MRAWTQILVALRNADPTALTALGCLRDSMGFGVRLEGVRRCVLWELEGPGGVDPEEVLAVLRRAGELFNPNKEAAHVRRAGEQASALGTPAPGEGGWESYLAWNPDRDLDRLPPALSAFRGRGWRLARGVLWSLLWREGDAEERTRWSQQAVLCVGPRQGLLVHPHLEDYRRIEAGEPAPWLPEPGRPGADVPRRQG
jgi:hypothetical protein